ncbi:hypothetical protein [Emcibacter sp.]|uniref:hypothetical protein n=1 Tax=Emcibacter sp. TaxID=1979954 RepID=UPI003A90BBA6
MKSITRIHLAAILSALIVSSFIVTEIALISSVIVSVITEGVPEFVIDGILSLGIFWFWIKFFLHVYRVEFSLLTDTVKEKAE